MRLMQLKALVLPAPLGPISANSSAGSTANDRPSSTVSPPKRRLKFSTSSSAIPPPAAAVLLDVAVAAALPLARLAEVELLDVGVAFEAGTVAIQHDAAVLQNIAVVGDLQRNGRALLHQHYGDAELALHLHQPRHQVVDHHWREAQRQLVHQQQLWLAHQ